MNEYVSVADGTDESGKEGLSVNRKDLITACRRCGGTGCVYSRILYCLPGSDQRARARSLYTLDALHASRQSMSERREHYDLWTEDRGRKYEV